MVIEFEGIIMRKLRIGRESYLMPIFNKFWVYLMFGLHSYQKKKNLRRKTVDVIDVKKSRWFKDQEFGSEIRWSKI